MNVLAQAGMVAALADPEVDRRTGLVAAMVTAPDAQGQIAEVLLWNPDTGLWQSTPPTMMVGQQFGVTVYATHTKAYAMNMYVVVTATAPDGSSDTQTLAAVRVDPGYTALWTQKWTANAVGEHTVDIVLYAEYAG